MFDPPSLLRQAGRSNRYTPYKESPQLTGWDNEDYIVLDIDEPPHTSRFLTPEPSPVRRFGLRTLREFNVQNPEKDSSYLPLESDDTSSWYDDIDIMSERGSIPLVPTHPKGSIANFVKEAFPTLHKERERQRSLTDEERDNERAASGGGERPPHRPATRCMRIKSSLKRYWWLTALVVASLITALICSIMFGVIPPVVRSRVSDQAFPIVNGTIEAVSPTKFRISLVSRVYGLDAIPVRFDAFNMTLHNAFLQGQDDQLLKNSEDPEMPLLGSALTPGLPESGNASGTHVNKHKTLHRSPLEIKTGIKMEHAHPAFATLHVPAMTVGKSADLIVPPQTVNVDNANELSIFLVRAFAGAPEDGAMLRFVASTWAHVGPINVRIDMNKVVRFGGLNNLTGTAVTRTDTVIPFDADGTNMEGELKVSNSSPFTLALGNTTYDLIGMMPGALEGPIGSTTVSNLVLRQGEQQLAYRGQLDVPNPMSVFMKLKQNSYAKETKKVKIAFRGNHSTIDGQQIHYLDQVLRKIDVRADVPMEVGDKIGFALARKNPKQFFSDDS